MPKLLTLPDDFNLGRRTFGFFDDLEGYVTGDRFTALAADSGASVARLDGAGGLVNLTTGGTDNNEAYLRTSQEIFLMAFDKPILIEARIRYTEANTDDANVAFGLMDAVGADSILDNGAGLKASYSGAAFFKVDGGVRWQVQSSLATNKVNTDLTAQNSLTKTVQTPGGGVWQTLRIEILPVSSVEAEVSFFIDGVIVAKHALTYTSATEMHAFVGVKAGGANSEVVTVDYLTAYQLR